MRKFTYDEAVTRCNTSWHRYGRLPWWRLLAKQTALRDAQIWGQLALKLKPRK